MLSKKARRLLTLLAIALVQAIALLPLAHTSAYDSGSKWITSRSINGSITTENVLFTRQYQVDPDLDYKLGLSGSLGSNLISKASLANAAGLWNRGAAFTLVESGGWDLGSSALVTAQNFVQASPCFGVNPTIEFGVTCYQDGVGAGMLGFTRVYLNTYSNTVWNTTGNWNPTGSPRQVDVFTIAFHEFGHMLYLYDMPKDHPEPVMWNAYPYPAKRVLEEDDKHGATMLYGPDTGFEWEQGWAKGQENRLAYALNAAGYFSSPGNPSYNPPPELGVVGREDSYNTLPYAWRADDANNARMLRLAGYSTSSSSYAYHILFTADDEKSDLEVGGNYWLRIQQDMVLQWCQKNVQQRTISLDLQFTDGSTLRDSGILAEGNRPVHPALRGNLPEDNGNWFCPKIVFRAGNPLIGKQIKHVLIAYDSGGGNTGAINQPYRAYFDEIKILPNETAAVQAFTLGSGGINTSWQGASATFTPAPAGGSTFIGWTYDGAPVGWANSLSVSSAASHRVSAIFAASQSFGDIGASPYQYAILQLAARGIVRGTGTNAFSPSSNVLRAQVAAFVCRSLGWDREDWGNPFPDQNGLNGDLWRNVGAMTHYGAAKGYANGNFGPNDSVTFAQSISFISRAMVAKGYWRQQPDNAALYPNVPASSGHRSDLATYVYYAGTIPGTTSTTATWANWTVVTTRDWFAQALWQALNSRFGIDPVP